MRFTILKDYLLKALTIASKAALGKSANPVFRNLKLTLSNKGLSVLGSNGELSISVDVNFNDGEKEVIRNYTTGDILIDAKSGTEFIRKLSGNEINVEIIDETVIHIDDGKTFSDLNTIRATEYPDIDLDSIGTNFDIATIDFANLVDQTAFAASLKEQRLILTALNLSITGGILTATATDSARMAKKMIPVSLADTISANINAKTLSDIVRLFENEEMVSISLDSTKAVFKFGEITVATTLINSDYPKTQNLIPQTFNYYLKVESNEFIDAMDRVASLSGERENVVKISVSEDSCEIMAKSSQLGSSREAISVFEYTGSKLDISFNSAYVISAIKALNSDEVTICFIGEMKPFVVKNDNDPSCVQLITPVRTY